MSGADEQGALPTSLRVLSVTLLVVVCIASLSGLFLSGRGQAEMRLSDRAFHEGDLRMSVVRARQAALAYVPGSGHVRAAYARLHAIARGAEAEGDFTLARIAWETLRQVHVQTDYPGRMDSELQKEAEAALARLDQKYRAEN